MAFKIRKSVSKPNDKKAHTAGEKRAYWLGLGFNAATMGMRSDQVYALMSEKEKASFVNGRTAAEEHTPKFVPDYVSNPNPSKRKK